MIKVDRMERERQRIQKMRNSELYDDPDSARDVSERMSLNSALEVEEEGVRSNKKKELREHQKIIQQFDKLATKFEKSSETTVKVQGKQGGKMVAETAGMLKKKTKKRKEKSLGAKLRLKEKKGDGKK